MSAVHAGELVVLGLARHGRACPERLMRPPAPGDIVRIQEVARDVICQIKYLAGEKNGAAQWMVSIGGAPRIVGQDQIAPDPAHAADLLRLITGTATDTDPPSDCA